MFLTFLLLLALGSVFVFFVLPSYTQFFAPSLSFFSFITFVHCHSSLQVFFYFTEYPSFNLTLYKSIN